MDLLEKFNQTFAEFIDDIARVLPKDPEFRMYQVAVTGVIAARPMFLQQVFHDKIAIPYGEALLARDESFFLAHDFSGIAGDNSNILALIDKIKDGCLKMSPADKDTVWKYFRVLLLLDRKITAALN